MKEECSKCHRHFNVVDEKTGLCFYCHLEEFGRVGQTWQPRGKYNEKQVMK